MLRQKSQRKFFEIVVVFILSFSFLQDQVIAQDFNRISMGNFGLPGIIDLPTAKRFPDGALVIGQQLHKSLACGHIISGSTPIGRIISLHWTWC